MSRVLNGADNVHPDTRTRVEQAIADLNYQPNFQARSLRSKRTYAIALAIPELTNYYWTSVARGVQDAAQARGYQVFLCNTRSPHHNHLQYLEMTLSRADGIILTRRSERDLIRAPKQDSTRQAVDGAKQVPAVYIDQSHAATWNIDTVHSDSISGAFALTSHLIRLGHRIIAIVSGRETSSSASDRVAGYCMALADVCIPIDAALIQWGEYHRKPAEQATLELLARKPEITAIVAANNEIAIGVMRALERLGQRVPQDVAVVGFSDFYPDSRYASMLTCLDASAYDIGVNAVQLLFNRMDSSVYQRARAGALPTRLIVRQSCGGQPTPAPADGEHRVDRVLGELTPTLDARKIAALLPQIQPFVKTEFAANNKPLPQPYRSDDNIRAVLTGAAPDTAPIPHFETIITNRWLYGDMLEREPSYDWNSPEKVES